MVFVYGHAAVLVIAFDYTSILVELEIWNSLVVDYIFHSNWNHWLGNESLLQATNKYHGKCRVSRA